MVEGDDVAALGEPLQRLAIGRRSDLDVGRDESGAIRRRLRQHPQRQTKRDRRLMGHPRQLPSAHHADYRQPGHSVGHQRF